VTTEANPAQTGEITRAIGEALAADKPVPDAWWQAGIEETLDDSSDGRAAPA